MGREGYLKLVDFGSAKKLVPPLMTNTICGTPEYVAPEMIAARGHNRAVDFWSLGVFLFELLHRATPFEQNDTVRSCSLLPPASLLLNSSLSAPHLTTGGCVSKDHPL
jgi:cGMP-dependent protein kinase 1